MKFNLVFDVSEFQKLFNIMDELTLAKIRNVLIVAESGKQVMQYSAVYVLPDGPNGIKQLTLSIGFTQYGNLAKVIEEYVKREGKHSAKLKPMLGVMRRMDTVSNSYYIGLLREAGADPVMQQVQDDMFNRLYLDRAIKWGKLEGFKESLSYLIIADSFLHSGSMLDSIRAKFRERTPANGGDEKAWTKAYLYARHEWLRLHSRTILRKTIYRTSYYKELIALEDWSLNRYYSMAMNGVKPLGVLA